MTSIVEQRAHTYTHTLIVCMRAAHLRVKKKIGSGAFAYGFLCFAIAARLPLLCVYIYN